RRVLWFAYAVAVVLIAISLLSIAVVGGINTPHRAIVLAPGVGGVVMIVMATLKLRRRRRNMSLHELVRRTSLFVVLAIVMQIPAAKATAEAITQTMRQAGLQHAHIGALMPLMVSLLCLHVIASLILPWSLFEAARPIGIIALIALLATPLAPDPWPARL